MRFRFVLWLRTPTSEFDESTFFYDVCNWTILFVFPKNTNEYNGHVLRHKIK